MRCWRIGVFGAVLAGILAGVAGVAPAHAAQAPACALPQGWSAVAARHPRFVVFGEVHGTREAPAFVGGLACGLAARGQRLLVGIEQSAQDDAALQAAWALPHARFADALRRVGWAGRQDGIASDAMFALLVRLHALKAQGRAIAVVAFSGTRDAAQRARLQDLHGQDGHEAAQAENLRAAAAAGRYDQVLVLVGNLHARKQPVGVAGAGFTPMAMRLGPPDAVVSLNMADAGGTAWNCVLRPGVSPRPGQLVTSDATECATRPQAGLADLHRAPFIGMGALPGGAPDPAYDGFFWLGPISGAPPAVPAS